MTSKRKFLMFRNMGVELLHQNNQRSQTRHSKLALNAKNIQALNEKNKPPASLEERCQDWVQTIPLKPEPIKNKILIKRNLFTGCNDLENDKANELPPSPPPEQHNGVIKESVFLQVTPKQGLPLTGRSSGCPVACKPKGKDILTEKRTSSLKHPDELQLQSPLKSLTPYLVSAEGKETDKAIALPLSPPPEQHNDVIKESVFLQVTPEQGLPLTGRSSGCPVACKPKGKDILTEKRTSSLKHPDELQLQSPLKSLTPCLVSAEGKETDKAIALPLSPPPEQHNDVIKESVFLQVTPEQGLPLTGRSSGCPVACKPKGKDILTEKRTSSLKHPDELQLQSPLKSLTPCLVSAEGKETDKAIALPLSPPPEQHNDVIKESVFLQVTPEQGLPSGACPGAPKPKGKNVLMLKRPFSFGTPGESRLWSSLKSSTLRTVAADVNVANNVTGTNQGDFEALDDGCMLLDRTSSARFSPDLRSCDSAFSPFLQDQVRNVTRRNESDFEVMDDGPMVLDRCSPLRFSPGHKSSDSSFLPFLQDPGPVLDDLALSGVDLSSGAVILPLDGPVDDNVIVVSQEVSSGTAIGEDQGRESFPEGNQVSDNDSSSKKKRKRSSTPGDKSPSRKRQVNRSNWKAVNVKALKDAGKPHTSLRGKQVAAKVLGPGCKSTCSRSCHANITEEQRQTIFNRYWELQNATRQWDLIARLVRIGEVHRRTLSVEDMVDDPFRNHTYEYYLYDPTTSRPIRVCQTMFVSTLAIGVRTVRTVITKLLSNDGKISPDKRGRHPKKTRLHPVLISSVVTHIKRFPLVESHYCRASSRRKYLDENLSVARMHRMYLLEQCAMEHVATIRQYRDIFNTRFNLAFFKPKKDQCSRCLHWKNLSAEEKLDEAKALEHEKHLNNKELIRQMRREDKEKSRDKESTTVTGKVIRVCTYDLQKVLYCPKGENAEFFYRRKLSCYNFTIFDSTVKQGYCYCWDQTIGKRGSEEMSSFVLNYIDTCVKDGVNEFHFYSDSATGQNKNQFLFSMYHLACMKYGIKIVHRWLEKGHTQMECDSIHARIETKTRRLIIFVPSQWWGYIKTAKVKKPAYITKEVTQEMILTFKDLASNFTWSKVPISKLRELTVDSSEPGEAHYKEDYNGHEFKASVLPKRPGRPINWKTYRLKPAYQRRIPLKPLELEDLLWYVQKGHIPNEHIDFYNALALIGADDGNSDSAEDGDDNVESDEDDGPGGSLVRDVTNIIDNNSLDDVPDMNAVADFENAEEEQEEEDTETEDVDTEDEYCDNSDLDSIDSEAFD